MGILPWSSEDDDSIDSIIQDAQNDVEEIDESAADWGTREESPTRTHQQSGADTEAQEVKIQKLEAHLEAIKERQETIQERSERFSEKIGSLREGLKDTQRDATEAMSKSERAEQLVAEVEPKEIDKKLSRMTAEHEALRDEITHAEEQRTQLRNRIRELKADVDEIGSIEAVRQLRDDAQATLKTAQKLSDEAQVNANRVQDIFETLKQKRQQIEQLDGKQQEHTERITNNTDRINTLEIELTGLDQEASDLRDKQEDISERLDEHDDRLSGFDNDLADIQHSLNAVEMSVERLEKHIDDIEEIDLATVADIQEAIRDIRATTPSKESFEHLKETVETLEDSQETLQGTIEELDALEGRVADLAEVGESLKTVQNDQVALRERIRDLDERTMDAEDVARHLADLERQVAHLESTIESHDLEEKVDRSTVETELRKVFEQTGSGHEGVAEGSKSTEIETLRDEIQELRDTQAALREEIEQNNTITGPEYGSFTTRQRLLTFVGALVMTFVVGLGLGLLWLGPLWLGLV